MNKAPVQNKTGESKNYLDSIIQTNCERLGISCEKPEGYDRRIEWEAMKPQPIIDDGFFSHIGFADDEKPSGISLSDLVKEVLGDAENSRIGFANEIFNIERYKDLLGALIEELYPNVFSRNIERVVFQIGSTFNDFSKGYRIWSYEDLDKVFQEFLHFLKNTLTNKIPKEILINIEQAIEKLYQAPQRSKKIGELISSVSHLAMNVALGDVLEKNEEPKIMITHHAHRGIARISFQDFQSLIREMKIEEKLDTPFQGVFPEGTIAEILEGATAKIEREISIMQDRMNILPVSAEQVGNFKGIIERFRYGIYHLHSAIWSAHKGGKKEEMNNAIRFAMTLIKGTQLEIAILLHKFGVTEILHSYYEGRKIIINGAIGDFEDFSRSGRGNFRLPGGLTAIEDIINK